MMPLSDAFQSHLSSGVTTLARCWQVTRRDGRVLGFTDHDGPLHFDGVTYLADAGLTALAVQHSTGLSVDNTEALGALSHAALTEADIQAGRYDGAEVVAYLVNWAEVAQRMILFRGHLGDITHTDGAFQAELRGLSDALNQPVGRIYQKPCAAVLGDARCRFDLTQEGFQWDTTLIRLADGVLHVPAFGAQPAGWFERGELTVLTGEAQGLRASIKRDAVQGDGRAITLWASLRAALQPGDRLRLTAGCDKRLETCRIKFDNVLNYQGFPDIPAEDWIAIHPGAAGAKA